VQYGWGTISKGRGDEAVMDRFQGVLQAQAKTSECILDVMDSLQKLKLGKI